MIGHGLSLLSAHASSLAALAFLDLRTATRTAGAFTLPSWLAITCATTGRTSQTAASTLRTGFGANAARARSVDGTAWALAVEKAATMFQTASDVSTWATLNASAVAIAGPGGAGTGARVTDTSATDLGFAYDPSAGAPNGSPVSVSIWATNNLGTGTIGSYNTNLSSSVNFTYPLGTTWARHDVTSAATTDAGTSSIAATALADGTQAGSIDVAYPQIEAGKYPTSAFPHVAAGVTRAADVLSVGTPSTVAPLGYFDMSMAFAPNYATAEQGGDHNLLYFNANNRLFLRQSDAKLVLRIGGANIATGALSWTRNQLIWLRAAHGPGGRVLLVNNGAPITAGAASAISLPSSVYLLGSNTGAEESADLAFVSFQEAA